MKILNMMRTRVRKKQYLRAGSIDFWSGDTIGIYRGQIEHSRFQFGHNHKPPYPFTYDEMKRLWYGIEREQLGWEDP